MQRSSIRGFKKRRSKRKIKHGSVLISGEVNRRSVKRWWTEEKVSIQFEPHCPEKLLYLRAIQGHSGTAYSGNARINHALEDNVLLPKYFAQYVYHVGNGKELRSIVHNGLVPRGFSTKTGTHAVFFTVLNPMDDEQGLRETFCDLSKVRIAPYKNTWKPLQHTVYWCNLLLAQEGGLQFYQTRSNAVVLFDTLPAEFIEKAMCMKTQ